MRIDGRSAHLNVEEIILEGGHTFAFCVIATIRKKAAVGPFDRYPLRMIADPGLRIFEG